MKKIQLTRWGRLSSARWKRPLRWCVVAVAVPTLLLLGACSGNPDALARVGPASTPNESEPEAYEPTLPPYTSEVELTPEDEEDVEELLLLTDEFMKLTSTLEEPTIRYAESLAGRVEDEMLEGYLGVMNEAIADRKQTNGAIVAKFSRVAEFGANRVIISTCYDFSEHIISDIDEPGVNLYPERPKTHAYDIVAKKVDDSWMLIDQYDSELDCV